jgi:hypothetical protein
MAKVTKGMMTNLARLADRYARLAKEDASYADLATDAADAAFDAEVAYSLRILMGKQVKEQTGTVRHGWSSLLADVVHGIGAADRIVTEEASVDPDADRIGQVWEDEAEECRACARSVAYVAKYGGEPRKCASHR